MTWINTISYQEAKGKLRQLYDRVAGPDNNVDNIMMAHSLRPHTMEAHMCMYKYVLHHNANTIPKWFLEAVGVFTSMLNQCGYCVEHHFAGLSRLLDDSQRASNIRIALESANPELAFDEKQVEALAYAALLTTDPSQVNEDSIRKMLSAGWEDGEILELNQTIAYFNYANRTVLGLGVHTDGDILGLSPGNSDDPENWQHR